MISITFVCLFFHFNYRINDINKKNERMIVSHIDILKYFMWNHHWDLAWSSSNALILILLKKIMSKRILKMAPKTTKGFFQTKTYLSSYSTLKAWSLNEPSRLSIVKDGLPSKSR